MQGTEMEKATEEIKLCFAAENGWPSKKKKKKKRITITQLKKMPFIYLYYSAATLTGVT